MKKIIVGLGNPGDEYVGTRHNVGFWFLDKFVEISNCSSKWEDAGPCLVLNCVAKEVPVMLVKPTTFMNRSGAAVRAVVQELGLAADDVRNLLVVHDDWAFGVGAYRLHCAKGANGHNGVQHIVDTLGTRDFCRLRIGINEDAGKFPDTPSDFVLSRFAQAELLTLESLLSEGLFSDVLSWLDDGT